MTDKTESVVDVMARLLFDEKIAALGVKPERFSYDRAPQQEQMDYERKVRSALKNAGYAVVPVEVGMGRILDALEAIGREGEELYHLEDLAAFYVAMIQAATGGE